MADHRTEDQKIAAVAASMTMAGQPVTPEVEATGRQILRGELSADQAVLEAMQRRGHGNSGRAEVLRRRIATAELDRPADEVTGQRADLRERWGEA